MRQRLDIFNLLAPLGIFLVGFAYYYEFRHLGWFMEDEGVLYYQYLRTHQGQLPYRDYFMGYSPLAYYLHAWIFDSFGVSIDVVRKFMAAVNALSAVGLFVVARRVVPIGYALIPSLLFLFMQPGDLGDVELHNAPYPFWYSIAFTIWGAWALLRFLEARGGWRDGIWLFATGVLGGLTLLTKQSAGIFFLWGASAFLASCPKRSGGTGEQGGAAPWSLRVGYLVLIPVSAVLVVKNFIGPASLALFVFPMTVLAMIGARRSSGAEEYRALATRLIWLSAGVALTCTPWVVYFAEEIGLGRFLSAIFWVGAEPDKNMFIPFPRPAIVTLLVLAPLTLWGLFGWYASRGRKNNRGNERTLTGPLHPWLRGAVLVGVGLVLGGLLTQRAVIAGLLTREYRLGEIYLAASTGIDNLAAYLSIIVLGGALIMLWRHGSGGEYPDGRPLEKQFCLLWIAAALFLQYYPRMDSAHLVGAAPLLYVVGATLLPPLRDSLRLLPAAVSPRTARIGFHTICVLTLLFVVGVKSTPKAYSRFMFERTEEGLRIVPTPKEWLRFGRGNLYFPIYDEARRRSIQDFGELVNYIRSNSEESDSIFAFPAMPMIYFVSERDNPTRHDYFFGNNVRFREQIELIRTLDEKEVPMVVIVNDPAEYFLSKGRNYTRLVWAYLQRRYYLERRIGQYDVLRRFDTDE